MGHSSTPGAPGCPDRAAAGVHAVAPAIGRVHSSSSGTQEAGLQADIPAQEQTEAGWGELGSVFTASNSQRCKLGQVNNTQ